MKKPIIYLIRKSGLGDVLWIEPVIRQLAEQYSKIIVYTKYNGLFENYPLSNVVFRNKLTWFEKAWYRLEDFLHLRLFTINLDKSYEKDPKRPMLHAYERKAGVEIRDEYPRIYLSDEEKEFPAGLSSKYIILHIESFTENFRRVYGIDWSKAVEYITKLGFTVVQIGIDPVPIKGSIVHKPSLRQMIRLIKHSRFFVGIDSGPSHIAASLGVPSLIFFGAVNPLYRHFLNQFKGYFLQQACECAGWYHEVVGRGKMTCSLVGDEGIPKCCLHSNEFLEKYIDSLLTSYS